MALLFVLAKVTQGSPKRFQEPFEVIHINHGTRDGNEAEAQLVQRFAKKLGVRCHVVRVDLSGGKDGEVGNFEKRARDMRYEVFKGFLRPGDMLYTAHHLDDSLEWSWLAQMKSSSISSSLGIPVIKGQIARPFMCVSRAQIENLVRVCKIPHCFDPTNLDESFERNYIRNVVVPKLKQRFPGYLKHYVYRSNDLAHRLNLSRFKQVARDQKQPLLIYRDAMGGVVVYNQQFSNNFDCYEEEIVEAIKMVSTNTRGVLRLQVSKMCAAVKKGKLGPLSFSGGVLGFMTYGMLYFVSQEVLSRYQKLDQQLCELIEEGAYIPKMRLAGHGELKTMLEVAHQRPGEFRYPFICFSNDENLQNILPSVKRAHPLLPGATRYAISNKIWFNYAPRVINCLQSRKFALFKYNMSIM